MEGRRIARPTVAQVAEAAGVSPSTVSKALNDTGQLSPATRRRVRETADRLGLLSRRAARSVSPGRTYTVALLTTDSIGRFSLPMLLGAENALALGQIMVLLCDTRDDPVRERYQLEHLIARRVDGVIVTGRRTEPRPRIEVPVPVVYAFARSDDDRDASVVSDDRAAGRLTVEHLGSLGRKRIAHLAGPHDHASARIRAEAVVEGIETSGAELAAAPLFGSWSEAWGRAGADVLLETAPSLDAITCGSDQIARGVVDRLRDRGVRVPADVAVTGIDDWDVIVDASRPPLTSVDLGLPDIGRLAARLLLDAIDGDPHTGVVAVPPRLVPRASTLGLD